MTPQELKSSILQLAFEGKLVSQISEEGTGDELFKKICSVSNISKKKIETEAILEDEIPFEFPSTWKCVRLSWIANTGAGGTPDRGNPEYWNGNVPWLKISDITSSNIYVNKSSEFISKKGLDNSSAKLIKKGAILYTIFATIGEVGILNFDASCNQAIAYIEPFIDIKKYLYWYLVNLKTFMVKQSKGCAQFNINQKILKNAVVPLPPLEEQKRIVAKIEELLPLVDRYEEAWNKLEKLNKEFPISLEKSILQYAMQGKLVKQIETESTGLSLLGKIKKVIKKDEIIDLSETPFDIPDSWTWVRIGWIFDHSAGKALNSSNREGKLYNYITTSNVFWNRFELTNLKQMFYKESELEKCSAKKGDLLVLEGGDVGRAAIWNYDYDIRIQNHIHRLRPLGQINVKFYYYVFKLLKSGGMISGKGIGIKGLSACALKSIIVPLPPFDEQNRIVDKIDELLPLCVKLTE